jgi:hypothetical protein
MAATPVFVSPVFFCFPFVTVLSPHVATCAKILHAGKPAIPRPQQCYGASQPSPAVAPQKRAGFNCLSRLDYMFFLPVQAEPPGRKTMAQPVRAGHDSFAWQQATAIY